MICCWRKRQSAKLIIVNSVNTFILFYSQHLHFVHTKSAQVSPQDTPDALVRRTLKRDINVDLMPTIHSDETDHMAKRALPEMKATRFKGLLSRLLESYGNSCNEYHNKEACKADWNCYWDKKKKKKHPQCNSHPSSSSGTSKKSGSSFKHSGSEKTASEHSGSSIDCHEIYYKEVCKVDKNCYWDKKKHPQCNSYPSSSGSSKHSANGDKTSSKQSGSRNNSEYECTEDSDCDDYDPCTSDTCYEGECAHHDIPEYMGDCSKSAVSTYCYYRDNKVSLKTNTHIHHFTFHSEKIHPRG